MDDDDDVAFDEGMEPESPTGADPGGGDDDDNYDDGDDDIAGAAVAHARGGAASEVDTPRTVRRISDKTRALMVEAAKKLKASGGAGDDDLDVLDHDELPMEPEYNPGAKDDNGTAIDPDDPTGQQAAKPPTPPPGQQQQQPPTPPPAPSLDPEVVKLREEFTTKIRELEEREAAISSRELEGDLAQLGEQYLEAGAPAVMSVLKKWLGGNPSNEELADEVADLIADLSKNVLGAEIPEQVQNRIDRRRTLRLVKHNKSSQERATRQAAEQARIAQEQADRVRIGAVLNQEIAKPESTQAYPFLAAEPDAGVIILDIVDAQHKKDGTKLTWMEAAKRANDYLEKQSRAWFDKRRHLLTTSNAGQANGGQQTQRTQGGQQVRSNAQQQQPPKQPPRQPPPQEERPWNAEEHRRQIKAKHRKAFQPPSGSSE